MQSIYNILKKRGQSIGVEGAKELGQELKELINLNSLTLDLKQNKRFFANECIIKMKKIKRRNLK